ncbi:MAG: hypothetical protein CMH63_02200 [Nanoarchaeota archaeon]|nr:hypothetical protein [Nanoarchaeota archaeon]|tara:strand:- start:7496 stop:7990 length:495 start_codon:yes stop_codon:yes gene_type:complete
MNKKGDATIIATVFLIVAAIGIGVLVTSFSKQTEEKVGERIVNLGSAVDCEDVRISIDDFEKDENNRLTLRNRGSLGIESAKIRVYSETISSVDSFFGSGGDGIACMGDGILNEKLMPNGKLATCNYNEPVTGDVYKIEVIPIIMVDEEELGCENRVSTWEPSE